jgi:NitT/TauT family transport system permease protein
MRTARKHDLFTFFDRQQPANRWLFPSIAFGLLIGAWSLASYGGWVNRLYLPTPGDTLGSLVDLFRSGDLWGHLLISLRRIIIGFSLASVLGVFFGSLSGTFINIRSLIMPVNSVLRYIQPTAFISLTILWFGIEEAGKIALIFIAIIFYIVQMVADVVKLVPVAYIESAQMMGARRSEIFRQVIAAYSLPDIISVLRINLGAAWTFLIVSELVAAQRGLGYLMATSQRFLQTPRLFALLIIVGTLGFVSDGILAQIIKRVSKWR